MPLIDPTCRLRVAIVQMNSADGIRGNLVKISRAAARAGDAGADAALFPECAITGYACDFEAIRPSEIRDALREVGQLAAQLGIHLLVGSPVFAGRRRFNGLVVFDKAGDLVHIYAKCQLTDFDRKWFTPGNSLSLFSIKGVLATAIVCHERRYPELVRLPVMAGAQVIFHPNAGLDALAVSRGKRGGRDGIAVRAFENAVFYVFTNTVGPQGGDLWSAGDSKIVGPDGTVLALADNKHEAVLTADLELSQATRKYGLQSLQHPRILARHWRSLLREVRQAVVRTDRRFLDWYQSLRK